MSDPKVLADRLETGKLTYTDTEHWLDWTDYPGDGARTLIIAALRAYVPPCVHDWLWTPYGVHVRYEGKCSKCGAHRYARDLVPVEDAS
jgi:hypothetical protein